MRVRCGVCGNEPSGTLAVNVREVCLAILNFREASGYEIKKLSTESHYAHFVDASFGSIYPALNKMEAEGLVTSREERQPGKPPRKMYAITDKGRDTLVEQLEVPPREDVFKSEFLLIAMCAHMLDRDTVRRAIDTNIAQTRAMIDKIEEAGRAERDVPGSGWLTRFGHTCMAAHLHFIEEHRAELEALAIQPAPLSEAAE